MKAVSMAILFGIAASAQPAQAAHCRYDRTSFIYGQDTQTRMTAPAAVPCHIFFRSAFGRSEWSVAQSPTHGVLVPVGNTGWNYIPARNYAGPDAFAVEVTGEIMGRYVYKGSSKVNFAVDVVP